MNNGFLTQRNNNLFLYFLIIVAAVYITWGFFIELQAGVLYFGLLIVILALFPFTLFYINAKDPKIVKQYFRTPFSADSRLAIGMFYIGFVAIMIINSIINIVSQGFSTTQFFTSLLSASQATTKIGQTFAAGVAENSMFNSLFYAVYVAPVIEEFVWAVALMLIFYTVAIFFVRVVFNDKAPFVKDNKTFYKAFAILLSALTFTAIHALNDSYEGIMFLIAAIFRMIMNTLVYFFNYTLTFLIGVHMGNNLIAWIQIFGIDQFIQALFTTVQGGITVILMALFLIYWLSDLPAFVESFRRRSRGLA